MVSYAILQSGAQDRRAQDRAASRAARKTGALLLPAGEKGAAKTSPPSDYY